ncbi:MAG: LiaI-LiaF-like domain-containing protein [Anaerolineales bacterium]
MIRRGSLFGGGILIVLAVLLLLKQAGIIVGDIFGYFWPLLIIAFGVWLIAGFFARNRPVEGEKVSIPLEGAASAYIKLDHGAGRLSVHSGASPNEIINGTFGNGLNYKSHLEGSRIDVKLRTAQQFWAWWPGESMDWDIHLNRDIPLNLKIDSGASASILDLSDLKVSNLDIDTGASSTDLTLPTLAENMHVDVDTGASSLKINIPTGVAASIRVKSGIAAVNVNPRFPRQDGGLYQSSDYAISTNRVDITIDAGVGSIEIN